MLRKILFFLIIVILGLLGLIYHQHLSTSRVTLVYTEDGFIRDMARKVTLELNKLIRKDNIATNKPIDLYVANFFKPHVPAIENGEHFNILWTGGYKDLDVNHTSQYDLIITSTPDLFSVFQTMNFNVHFFPLVNTGEEFEPSSCVSSFDKNQCYYVVFGEAPEVINVFQKNNIVYKTYEKADYQTQQEIMKEINMVSGIVANNVMVTDNSLDISPFFLNMIMRKIPILTKFVFGNDEHYNNFSLNSLLGDLIHYYVNETDVETFLHDSEYQKEKSEKASYFSKYLLSPEAMAKWLVTVIQTQQDSNLKIPNSYNIMAPIYPGQYNNGDYWIAKDLENSFGKHHFSITTFGLAILHDFTDVNIYIRGGLAIQEDLKKNDTVNILYILFPMLSEEELLQHTLLNPDKYFDEIKDEFPRVDSITVSSSSYTKFLNSKGIKAYYVPQFTNPEKFYPDYTENLKTNVIFVGNSAFYRKAPQFLQKNNIKADIYGRGWGDMAKAEYIDNKILRKYYSSAKIVLNDTRPAMKEFGFISNRIFDATACGTLVISDYMPEIEEIYGDSVPMWKTEKELVELIKYYLDPTHEEERLEKAKRAQEITLQNFTAEKVAKQFEEIIQQVRAEKGI